MRLITYHPVKFGALRISKSSYLDDLLELLEIKQSQFSYSISDTQATEYMRALYPQKLIVDEIDLSSYQDAGLISLRLEVYPSGLGGFMIEMDFGSNFLDRDTLIDFVENVIRSEVCDDLLQSDLCKIIKSSFVDSSFPDGIITKAELMYAYSQTLFYDDDEWGSFASLREGVSSICADFGELFVDASFNHLKLKDPNKAIYFSELISSITLLTAMAYCLQREGLSVSREILMNNLFIEQDYLELKKYIHWVDLCEQFYVELSQEDFLANVDEQEVAKNIADNWSYSDLCSRVGQVVKASANHIRSIESKRTFRNQDRANLIFLAFTLISIVSVSGDLLALYDIGNKIVTIVRLFVVSSAFAIVTLFVLMFLKNR